MDSQPDTLDDVSALAWVQDELRKSLDAVHKALRRTLKEAEAADGSDLDGVEPAQLRSARQQLHQGVGVLELVGLPAGATLLRACENLVQQFVAKPHKLSLAAVEAVERSSFALQDFLTRRLSGAQVSPVALFPQYRAVQELAGADRAHPADLWPQDWQWHMLPPDAQTPPRQADAALVREFETQVLSLMRAGGGPAMRRLSDLSAGLAAGAEVPQVGTLWQLAAAFFEAQEHGLLTPDVYTKRVTSRLLAQLRRQRSADAPTVAAASERLAQDLNFFCAQATTPGPGQAPRLSAAHHAYPPTRDAVPADYSTVQLGRYDPAWITQARKRVVAAKDAWSAVAGGETHRLHGLTEHFALLADSLKRLVPQGERLGDALSKAAAQSVHAGAAPAPALAMEIATSVLYLEAALEEGAFDQPAQTERVQHLAQRVDAALAGAPPAPLEPWMEELYRRVSDRQTMGSVVHELRTALSEAEKAIDQFFRAPADPAVLIPVPATLQTMRGVLSVLGFEDASHAVVRMRDDVDALTAAGDEARHQQPLFERLAGNLSALSFLIDLLGVQPQVAKTMFAFDADSGLLQSVLGRRGTPLEAAAATRLAPALIEQAQQLAEAVGRLDTPLAEVSQAIERLAQAPEVAAQDDLSANLWQAQAALDRIDAPFDERQTEARVREQIAEALAEFVTTGCDPIGLDVIESRLPADAAVPTAAAAPPAVPTPAPVAAQSSGLEQDAEMRGIFLEEAREVLESADDALAALAEVLDDLGQLTTVRRAFHTLKGSARMVGLDAFGDAGWACEQLYNAALATQAPASPALLQFTHQALALLGQWVEAIASGADADWHSGAIRDAADRLRTEGRFDGIGPGRDVAQDFAALGLPSAEDLDLAPVPAAAPATAASGQLPGLDFSFDLDDGLAPEPAPDAAPQATLEPSWSDLPSAPDEREFDHAPALPLADEHIELIVDDGLPLASEFAEAIDAELDREPHITSLQLDVPSTFEEPAEALLAEPSDVHELHVEPAAAAEPFESIGDGRPPATPALGNAAADATSDEPPADPIDDDQVKVIGPLRIGIPLFNIYLNEADELSRRLGTELSEWSHELDRPVGESAVTLAHSLAGSSATVGFADLSGLARLLEHALVRSQTLGHGTPDDAALFTEVSDELRRLLHQFAAGFLKPVPDGLSERLQAHEAALLRRIEAASDVPADDAAALAATPEPPAAAVRAEAGPADAALGDSEPRAAEEAPAPPPIGERLQPPPAAAAVAAFAPASQAAQRAAAHSALDSDEDIDAVDAIDADLFPFFEEEAHDLLPDLAGHLRAWVAQPTDGACAAAAMRALHTFKGGARLAGAMRLGELAHRLETAIEHQLARGEALPVELERLLGRADGLNAAFEQLRQRDALAYEAASQAAQAQTARDLAMTSAAGPVFADADAEATGARAPAAPSVVHDDATAPAAPLMEEQPSAPPVDHRPAAPSVDEQPTAPSAGHPSAIDWSRFAAGAPGALPQTAAERAPLASAAAVRVRTQLLDRMVNQAGEVSIARARLESEVGQIKGSLGDLTDNLDRLRGHLRDIELQAETQMSTRMEAAKAAAQAFDPLEFDRFTRFQELTRMMAESVNDVATVQRSLQRTLQTAEDELAAQARLTRDLQDDLLRTRMVEFDGLSDRLYRIVRQTAKETGKQVRLDIVGGRVEVDRGVLDRMTGAFEHLLRNCITHGIEPPAVRERIGKDVTGNITVSLHQEGNEVSVEFRDDGAGLDLPRIRAKGEAAGLVAADAEPTDSQLADLIFTPGFSTADAVTELSGRGVGMDVVRAEVNALGGRIETSSVAGQGTGFKLVLPLTTAVTQVVMLRGGGATVAVPATLVEMVRRATPDEIETAYAQGSYLYGDHALPFFWLGALLQTSPRGTDMAGARTVPVVVVRSAQQRLALHVDEVLGHQEVVVKNLGPQLSRLPGLAGMTLLASGAVSLIYNPVALATVYGEAARRAMATSTLPAVDMPRPDETPPATPAAATVLVVDDSLTVRRVTQRLLAREGYRVVLAKDGFEALARLAEERPAVVLSDIEMPRMDGFDLVRNIRSDAHLASLPVIMITSRIAQKHRDYAAELGVNHYLGKPYSEEELLALIGRYCTSTAMV